MQSQSLRNRILEQFHLALAREAELEGKLHERGKPFVTGLTSECLRYCYYELTCPNIIMDPRSAIRVWIGRQLHKTPILGGVVEMELEYEGVVGRIDEIKDGVLIEKKIVRRIPRQPFPHHVKQVEYYWLLCQKNNIHVKEAAIIYIDVGSAEVGVFQIELAKSLDEVEKELLQKRDAILKCLNMGILPPRKVATWDETTHTLICQYCEFYGLCMREDVLDPRFAKGSKEVRKEA